MKPRLLVLTGLLVSGVVLGIVIYGAQVQPPVAPTFTSAFQIFGETVRVADRFAGRLMPVNDFDEAALGEALKSHYVANDTPVDVYVNKILQDVSAYAKKDFSYNAYLLDWDVPNAMALPGGLVFVTTGLLKTLDNEAQLAAVLAHEVGHIELSHCVDQMKYEITAKKLGVKALGELADMTVRLMIRHSFSKTQEHEADLYAWTWLSHSRYDPAGVGGSFAALQRWDRERSQRGAGYKPGLLRDYFLSHPPLPVREHEFRSRADRWWRRHPDEQRYSGARNLATRDALAEGPGLDEEWVTKSD